MFGLGLGSVLRLVAPTLAGVAYKSVKDLIKGDSPKVGEMVEKGLINPEDSLVDEDIQVIEDINISDELTNILVQMVPLAIRSDLDDGSKNTSATASSIIPYLYRLIMILEQIRDVANQVDSAIPDKNN